MKLRTWAVVVGLALSFLCDAQDLTQSTQQNSTEHSSSAPPDSATTNNSRISPETITPKSPDGSNIVPVRLVSGADPKYPDEAKKNNLAGTVVLEATIEKNGKISNLGILDGDLVLAEAAVDAVRSWRFEPYRLNGRPAKIQQELAFAFVPSEGAGKLDAHLPPPILSFPGQSKVPRQNGVWRVGDGVSVPQTIYAPDPDYSKIARKAGYEGTCVLSLIVGTDGQPHDIKVVRALGQGLDLKATETVSKWRFRPGTKDGKPVAVYATIEVTFRLN